MREIKFEIKLKAIEPINGYNIGETVIVVNSIFNRISGFSFNPINYNFSIVYCRQFTGLRDKNGNDIYEGDILEYKNELGRHYKYIVFEVDGGFAINTFDSDFGKPTPFYDSCADMQTAQWIKQCIVIGNIYENPELLNNPQ